MKNSRRHITIPLQGLLHRLKRNGFELTIGQMLEVQTILLSTPLSGLPASQLKYLITPVFARNDKDQHEIYEIIDEWVNERTEVHEPAPKRIQRWLKQHAYLLFFIKVAVVLLVIALAVFIYVITTGDPGVTPKNTNHKAGERFSDSIKTAQLDEKQYNLPVYPAPAPNSPVQPVPETKKMELDYKTAFGDPIPPATVDNRLPLSLVFGFVMGAILFHMISYEKKKRMELNKRKRTEDAVFTIPEQEGDRSLFPYNDMEQLQQLNLQFVNSDYLVQRPSNLRKIKNILQTPAYVDNPPIDIKASIAKSARGGGFTEVVRESEWKDRKYIFLCDRKNEDAHMTHLLDYVVKYLKTANQHITCYYYTTDISLLQDINGRAVRLEQLAFQYPHHHLIVIGYYKSLFRLEGLLLNEPVMAQLKEWSSRSVITPLAFPDWTYQETQLQENGFLLVPADLEAIGLLANAITEQAVLNQEVLKRQLGHTHGISGYQLGIADSIRAYLGNTQLFQAVCALAVYPMLKWPVTLNIWAALEKKWPGFVLDYDNLLKIARIPWMHTGKWEPEIRLQLLDALDKQIELIAREAILKELDEMRSGMAGDSVAFAGLQVQYNINAFFLYQHDQLQYRRYADVKEVIGYYWNNVDDWALKEHINKRQSQLVSGNQVKASSAVEQFVVQEKQFEKLNTRLANMAMTTLPAALLFILFTIFKPRIVYSEDSMQEVSISAIIKKDSTCRQHLVRADIGNEIVSRSMLLNPGRNSDTLMISGIRRDSHLKLQLQSDNGIVYDISVPASYEVCEIIVQCNR